MVRTLVAVSFVLLQGCFGQESASFVTEGFAPALQGERAGKASTADLRSDFVDMQLPEAVPGEEAQAVELQEPGTEVEQPSVQPVASTRAQKAMALTLYGVLYGALGAARIYYFSNQVGRSLERPRVPVRFSLNNTVPMTPRNVHVVQQPVVQPVPSVSSHGADDFDVLQSRLNALNDSTSDDDSFVGLIKTATGYVAKYGNNENGPELPVGAILTDGGLLVKEYFAKGKGGYKLISAAELATFTIKQSN